MRRAFWLIAAASVGFWLDEVLRLVYRRTQFTPARGSLPNVVPITNRRNPA